MTASCATRTSNPASVRARGEHASDARLPLHPSSAAKGSKGISRQQNKQTESGEDNLQQQDGGGDIPLNVADPEAPDGIWIDQAELTLAQDKIGTLTENAAVALELLSQVEHENEGLRLHVAQLEKQAKEPDARSRIGADLHHGDQSEPSDALSGQKRGIFQKESADTMTPQKRIETNNELALLSRLVELEHQMKSSSYASVSNAQHPREAPLEISTSSSRQPEDSLQGHSAGTLGLRPS